MGLVGLGIILLIIGFLIGSAVLWTIGIICIVVGVILAIVHTAEAPWYRRWY
ncbi:MAG TPA: hypothetical protein VFC33_10400 [Acidimicrobiia bacterium]|nr:hypothetical protein [Acidimicrobiia bacterium]